MERTCYTLLHGATLEDKSRITVMRGPTQISIAFCHVRIEKTRFGKEYLERIRRRQEYIDDTSNTHKHPSDLICLQCLPLLKKLAPQTSIQGLTIEDLCNSPTYHLEFSGVGSEEDIHIEGADNVLYRPSYNISPLPTSDLPESCKAVPRIQAACVSIVPTEENSDPWNTSTVQEKISTPGGIVRYFKPRTLGRETEFEREALILGQINEAGLRGDQIRLPELVGIVVSGEQGEKTIGMLMKWIPSSTTGKYLLSRGFWDQYELHKKWEEQVTRTVQKLHDHGIVWGDVNPCNVVIDSTLDAWVVDFGGLNNPEFVDDSKAETIDGDWQGVRRLFQEWLPSRRI